jgi:hypothetical protein
MRSSIGIVFGIVGLCALAGGSFAAEPAGAASAPPASAPAAAAKDENPPMVPPAKPGVFTMQKKGANGFHLVVTARQFTSRSDIEKYLAYRAAELTLEQRANWFTFTESRSKDSTVPVPKRDPAGLRYSFRMDYWRPVWRYKLTGDPAWKSWSPFTGAAFFADGKDPKTITDYEVSADIVVRKGPMDDTDPLAFEAGAVSDLLINQVSPPA